MVSSANSFQSSCSTARSRSAISSNTDSLLRATEALRERTYGGEGEGGGGKETQACEKKRINLLNPACRIVLTFQCLQTPQKE